PPPLEIQPAIASTGSQLCYSTVVDIAAAVKYDVGDAFFSSSRSDQLTDLESAFLVAAAYVKTFFGGSSRSDGHAVYVINQLCVDMLRGAENAQTGALRSTGDFITNSPMSL